MEIRFAAPPTLPFLHDVQPFPVPQFQGDQLENEKIHSAISGYFPRPHLYSDELRMDASCPVSRVSALRISAAVAVARMAARDRRRDRRRRLRRSDRAGLVRS